MGKGKPGVRPSGNVRLKDVAQEAGVSTATISRYLNDPDSLSEPMGEKVREAIKKLDWVPNAAARALANNRTQTVGVIIPTLDHQNFARMVQSLQAELMEVGLTMIVGCTNYDSLATEVQVRTMIERGVEAICLIGREHSTNVFKLLERHSIKYLLLYSAPSDQDQAPVIGFDNQGAFYEMTRRLLKVGHKRFGIIAQSLTANDRARSRIEGITQALAEEGIAVRPMHYVEGHWELSDGRAGFKKIMETSEPPTAIVCGNDYLAVGAILEAQSLGIRVPEDVSIVGFDDIELAKHVSPPLTTVRVPDEEIGVAAARHLTELLSGRTPKPAENQPVSPVERGSVAPPKITSV